MALLLRVIEPLALPAAEGAKVTVRTTISEGFKVAGGVRPVTEKALPVAATEEMFTAALPVLVMVTCCWEVLPVATVPKLKVEGLALN